MSNNNKSFLEECREYAALSNSDKQFLKENFPLTYTAIESLADKNLGTFIKVLIKESKLPVISSFADHTNEFTQMIVPEFNKCPAPPNYIANPKVNFHEAIIGAFTRIITKLQQRRFDWLDYFKEFCFIETNFDKYEYDSQASYDNSMFCLCIYYREKCNTVPGDDREVARTLYRWANTMRKRRYVYGFDFGSDMNTMYNKINNELRHGNLYAPNDVIPLSLLMKDPSSKQSTVAEIIDDLSFITLYQGVTVLADNTGVNLTKLCEDFDARTNQHMMIEDRTDTELGINTHIVKFNDPMIVFNYQVEDSHCIGFIINCDHPDALLYLTKLRRVIDEYGDLDSEPVSDYIEQFLLSYGHGFAELDFDTPSYGYINKLSDIDEFVDYALERDTEYEWTK